MKNAMQFCEISNITDGFRDYLRLHSSFFIPYFYMLFLIIAKLNLVSPDLLQFLEYNPKLRSLTKPTKSRIIKATPHNYCRSIAPSDL